jgi:hypothetical protein
MIDMKTNLQSQLHTPTVRPLNRKAVRAHSFIVAASFFSLLAVGCATLRDDTSGKGATFLRAGETVVIVPGDPSPALGWFDWNMTKSPCERAKECPSGVGVATMKAVSDWVERTGGLEAAVLAMAVVAPASVVAAGEYAVRTAQGPLLNVPRDQAAAAVPAFYHAAIDAESHRKVPELIRKRMIASADYRVVLLQSHLEPNPPDSSVILQVEILNLALRRSSHFSQRLEFSAVAYEKMTCARSGEPLGRTAVKYAGGKKRAFRFEDWTADEASLLREELDRSQVALADGIVQELLLPR